MAGDIEFTQDESNAIPAAPVEMPAESVVAPAAPDPIAQEFTWESGQPQGPAQWDQYLESIDLPPVGRTPAPKTLSQSSSSSTRGITDKGIAQTQKLTGFNAIDSRTDAAMAPQKAFLDGLQGRYAHDYAAQADATRELAAAHEEHANRTRALNERIADFHETAAHVEEQARAQSKAEQAQYLGEYQQQLAGVRQLAAQNPNPLAKVSGAQGFSLGAAMFAQGFLAARGVHIDVTGQVDRWVQREIDEHQRAIQNARQGAEDQLSLYSLARQSSADDAEARMKLRGFVIAGFQSRLAAEGDRFQSSIAKSQANAQIAKLDVELNATTERLGNQFFQQRQQTRQALVTEHFEQGKLALQAEQNAIARKAQALAEKKANQENGLRWTKISNPGEVKYDPKTKKAITGGRFDWVVDQKDEFKSKKALEARESYGNMRTGLEHLKDLQKNLDVKFGPDWYKNRSSEAFRLWENQRTLLVAQIQKDMTGMAATKEEVQKYTNLLQSEKWLEAGGHGKDAIEFDNWGREKFENAMDTYAIKREAAVQHGIVDNNPDDYDTIKTANSAGKAEYDAAFNSSYMPRPVDDEAAKAAGSKPSAEKGSASGTYLGFLKARGDKSPEWTAKNAGQDDRYKAIDHLAGAAIKPDKYAQYVGTIDGAPAESADDISTGALTKLHELAAGGYGERKVDPNVSAYARFVLAKIGPVATDPWGVEPKAADALYRDLTQAEANPTGDNPEVGAGWGDIAPGANVLDLVPFGSGSRESLHRSGTPINR